MPEVSRFGRLAWLWLALLVFVLDQGSKQVVLQVLEYGQRVVVLDGYFDWIHVYNRGAAFSFLAGESGWQRWFFAAIALGVSAVLVVWMKRLKADETWLAIALALVLGGALGNLYDRIVLGHVVDFILVHWQSQYYFPAFNLADSGITVGAVMLALDMFKSKKSGEPAHD
ncbi:prolipoprotein signal peptidase (signal peptidase II) [Pseudomonas sp. 8AS]|uniref:signal peptidase II n=1 Tax=Pseudomonas sp. 8AS TaxID=2653163 RepID=UPI0012F2C51E|nr:signal peptidase II [Pseudomonas sp. 8AS]VXB27508.1 prolipoprotein signal peptidase (signal peptidase II) [Pseudomonas sp. 8AS]